MEINQKRVQALVDIVLTDGYHKDIDVSFDENSTADEVHEAAKQVFNSNYILMLQHIIEIEKLKAPIEVSFDIAEAHMFELRETQYNPNLAKESYIEFIGRVNALEQKNPDFPIGLLSKKRGLAAFHLGLLNLNGDVQHKIPRNIVKAQYWLELAKKYECNEASLFLQTEIFTASLSGK